MATVVDRSGVGTLDYTLVKYNRISPDNPNGVLVPLFSGEIVLDVTNDVLWQAQSPANDTWVQGVKVL